MANDQNKYAGISTLRTFLSQLKNLFITKTDADAALSGKADTTHKHDSDYDAKGSASTALDSAKAYADQNKVPTSRTVNGKALTSNITLSASDVGALPNTTSIPDALSDLSSDSTHRTVTDAEKATWNAKSNFSGSYNDLTNKPTIPSIAGLATETYADSAAVTAANKVKNDLLNGAGTAYDTLKELGDLIVDNTDAIDALETIASGKADAEHSHAISDVSGLQSALDGKAASSHGTHVSFDSTNKPKMDGTAAFGSSSKVARADHVHPTDTSRAAQTDLDAHTENTTVHITSTERSNWNAAKTHADSAHAPSNAEKNQNAFSNIKVGSTTIAADTTTDTLELVGSNVTLTPDATNDKVTISVADGSTSAKGVVKLTNSTSSTSTTTAATPSSVKSAYDLANTAKTNAATAQTRADDAYTLAESKVDSLSDLGITATATELNYVDGVTSNIQTQLDGKSDSSHTHNYAGSSSAGGAATSANKVNKSLVVKLNGGATEGTNLFTFNGSAAKSVDITPSAIGASASGHTHDDRYYTETEVDSKLSGKANTSHGNHVPTTQTANSATFLRNDNTWQKVTPANIGAAESSHTHTVANITDLTATATELNYMDGVTSSVQTQLDAKQATVTGAATTITGSNLSKSRALISNSSGKIAVSAVTSTELGYLDGVKSNVQTQLDELRNDVDAIPQSDWNQNDSTQLDYVKNRPFYTTDPVETVIAEGTIPANGMLQTSASINSLTLGETYNVVFDGTVYNNLVCENYDGLPSIGNNAFMFAIQSGRAMAYAANGSASHTIKVMALLSSIIPLERKYIAEHIDNLAGEKVAGKAYTVDGAQVTAGKGAEVFNDYDTNIASGQYSHAEGMKNIASGSTSHAEGWSTVASGSYSHAEGYETTASASRSHAEGWSTEATGQAAHAEGFATHATGQYSHAEGDNAVASGRASHAEGYSTDAVADYSHAEGMQTNASSEYQHVQGKFNVIDAEDKYAHIVGNGTSNSSRKNIHTVDWKGNAWFAADIYVGGTGQDDSAVVKVCTEADSVVYSDDTDEYTATTLLNADTLGGKPLSDFMTNGKVGNLKYSDVGAASGAYGLGASVNWDYPSANDIQVTGFYTCNVDVPSNAYWYGMHIRYDANSAYQYFVHAEQYYCAERRKINGVWQPWEWVNPPMTLGVEYRTTERWNGKVVYTKLLDLGYVGAGYSSFTDGVNFPRVVRFAAVHGFEGVPLNGCGNAISAYEKQIAVSTNAIHFWGASAITGGNLYVQVWYHKAD